MMTTSPLYSTLKALAFVALLAGPSTLLAQDDETEPQDSAVTDDGGRKRMSGGYGYFIPGGLMYSLDDFNQYFEPQAFAPVADNGISMGGGGMLIARNVIIGGEGHRILRKTASSSLLDAELQSGWGQFQLGYVVMAKKGIMLYPKLGIGGYTHELQLKEQLASTTMDTIVAGDYSGTLLTRRGILASGELGFDWMPGFDESSGGGLVFGLSVGYQLALGEKGWESYEVPVNGGPDVDLSGLYVRLRIGFGGWNLQQ